jgi:hypothetical protein
VIDLLQIILTAVFSAGAVWGVVKVELHYLRRDIDAAHARLDQLGAPGAWHVKR